MNMIIITNSHCILLEKQIKIEETLIEPPLYKDISGKNYAKIKCIIW